MPDIEKVTAWLNEIVNMLGSFTGESEQEVCQLAKDALELLKEHQKIRFEIAYEIVSGSILMYQGKELIRCKNCTNGVIYCDNGDIICDHVDSNGNDTHPADWFCADGERKEGR